jgi:HK97 family phage prohead protease
MKIETGFTLELDTKGVSDGGEFEGYASVWDRMDLGRDVVRKGAFTKSLTVRPAGKIKMLRQHDTSDPIGVWTALSEDSRGLHVKGRVIRETARGSETYVLMKEGALDGLSIGYRTLKDSYDRQKSIRYLEEVDLREISIVTFPMLPDATVSAVKGEQATERARQIVAALNRATSALRSL